MKEQETLANAKADPHHYWNNRKGFQKAAWIVSLIAGAISAGADQTKNVGLKMLMEEIDQDLAQQNVEHQRKQAALDAKGRAMQMRQDRGFGRLKDRESAAMQRLIGVEKYLMAKAKVPGPEAQRAAYLQAAGLVAEKKMALVEKRVDTFHQNARASADRAVQYARMKQDQAQFEAQKQWEKQKFAIDTQKDYDLAQMQYDAKITGAAAQGQGDQMVLPQSTGFRIIGPDGKPQDITVHKDRYKDVSQVAAVQTAKATALQNLKKAFENASNVERWMSNDAELQSAINQAVGPVARALNGGGQLTEADVARAHQVVLGMDMQSIISKAKGPGKAEVAELIRKQIESLPEQAANEIAIASGARLPAGAKIAYTPRGDLGWKDKAPAPTADDAAAAAGLKVEGPKHPQSVKEYREAVKTGKQYGYEAVPALPPQLDEIVSKASAVITTQPQRASEAAKAAAKALEDYAAAHPDQAAQVKGARVRLDAAVEDGAKAVQDLEYAVTAAVTQLELSRGTANAKEVVEQQVKEAGLAIQGPQLKALVDEVNERLKAKYGLSKGKLGGKVTKETKAE